MTKQRNESDCCVASVANAVGVSYKTVKDRFGRLDRGGMQHHELNWILSEFGEWRYTQPRKLVPIVDWVRRHKEGRYVVILDQLFSAHAVAVVDGKVIGEYAESWRVNAYWKLVNK